MTGHLLAVASNRLFREAVDPFVHSYAVDIDFRGPVPAVRVSEGVTHDGVGAKLSPGEALMSDGETHFRDARAEWLRPYPERVARGEVVTEAELIRNFVRLHGRAPEAIA